MERFLFFLAVCFSIACKETPVKNEDKTTAVFSYFLKTAFDDSIKEAKQVYILIPKMGCKGCREDALRTLQQEINQRGNQNITYIFSSAVLIADTFAAKQNVLIDSTGLLDKINLPISNITILKTDKKQVNSIVTIRSEMMDSIAFYLDH
ncbi:hypothetical protein BH11BAC7_BH11BAC7_15430 [soil metagenome]